uniref:Secreted protein n=1 Tax=Aegilops tauschii subsp. strangulata TaxID=200361 RepID=A0A453LJB4_AEGTS
MEGWSMKNILAFLTIARASTTVHFHPTSIGCCITCHTAGLIKSYQITLSLQHCTCHVYSLVSCGPVHT